VHDARLDDRLGEDGFDGLGEALESVAAGDEDILTPLFFSSVTTISQNFAPSFCSSQRPSTSFLPSGLMPSARYADFFPTRPRSRTLITNASRYRRTSRPCHSSRSSTVP
jgi:hypothetical protein